MKAPTEVDRYQNPTAEYRIKVQVIKFNKETRRISLGMKQLQDDPWDLVAANYPLGSIHRGVVTIVTDYGAFVELEAGVEGLVCVRDVLDQEKRPSRRDRFEEPGSRCHGSGNRQRQGSRVSRPEADSAQHR